MRVGSLFSGIGGLDCGLARAGHDHAFFCEWDPYRRDVLRTRWPGTPVFGDVCTLGEPAWGTAFDDEGPSVDFGRWETGTGLLCGGFPCQDLSVAGKRAGLNGARSGLFHEYARIADALRPRWLLVENVPGLLSSNGGRDFGVVLGTLADLGYGVARRVLDSRFFGVPQRRRRVFIVGAIADGDPRAAAERAGQVLAVGEGCKRHSKTRGEARTDVAGTLGASVGEGRGWDANPTTLIANSISKSGPPGTRRDDDAALVANTLRSNERNTSQGPGNYVTHALTSEGHDASEDGTGRGTPIVAAPLTKGSATGEGVGRRDEDDPNLVTAVGVRRLTPTECERLQGLPDGWTQLGNTPDSKRYSALGDAVTANVGEWIGGRLA